ncbi:MAG: hypothetical protein SGPRY_010473, partial [Prymnesium sp.]
VIADNEAGLLFKNKRDRKVSHPCLAARLLHPPPLSRSHPVKLQVINVDAKARPGDNSRRIELHTHEYTQVTSQLPSCPSLPSERFWAVCRWCCTIT